MKMIKNVSVPARYLLLISLGLLALLAYWDYQREKTIVLDLGFYAGSSWNVPNGNDYYVIDQAIRKFVARHSNVTIRYESGVAKSDYSNWLSEKMVAGRQPDIFILPENDFNLLSSTGALYSLDKLMANSFATKDIYPSALQAGRSNGVQYALPFESNPMMMCINMDLLEKEGISLPDSNWTIEDFFEICRQVTRDTDGDGVVDQFGVAGYSWQLAAVAYGAKLFDDTGSKAYFDSSELNDALSFMTEIEALTGNYQVSIQDFDEGRVAFLPMTLAEYRTYKPYPYHVAKYSTFAWSCVTMPSQSATNRTSQVSTSLYAISSKAKYPDLAWEFLQLLCTDQEIQQTVFDESQGTSILKSVITSPRTEQTLKADGFGSDSLSIRTLDSILSQGRTEPRFKTYNQMMEHADYLISRALNQNRIEKDLLSIQKAMQDRLK